MRAAVVGVLAWLLMISPALGFADAQGSAASRFKPGELEQIAAPVALYADPLLAQALMASTYPLEVVQAARFVGANPSLKGEQLSAALNHEGIVYQEDLGSNTAAVAEGMTRFNPDRSWTKLDALALASSGG